MTGDHPWAWAMELSFCLLHQLSSVADQLPMLPNGSAYADSSQLMTHPVGGTRADSWDSFSLGVAILFVRSLEAVSSSSLCMRMRTLSQNADSACQTRAAQPGRLLT